MEKLYHLAKLDTENMRIDTFSPAQFNRFFEAVNIND